MHEIFHPDKYGKEPEQRMSWIERRTMGFPGITALRRLHSSKDTSRGQA